MINNGKINLKHRLLFEAVGQPLIIKECKDDEGIVICSCYGTGDTECYFKEN